MSDDERPQLLKKLVSALEGFGARRITLTGGVALGVWGRARQTDDIDVCGELPLSAVDPLLSRFDGVRSGPEQVPDMLRLTIGGWDIDLFVAKTAFDTQVLDRAMETEVDGVRLRVVTAEDLVLHKFKKLRTDRRTILQDAADLRNVFDTHGETLDWRYIEGWLESNELAALRALRSGEDEEFLRRIRTS